MCAYVSPFTRHLNDAAAESAKTVDKVKRMKDGREECDEGEREGGERQDEQ